MDALSKWAWFDLCYMFSDRDFVSDMLETDEKVLAKHVTVNKDGSVTLKKTNYSWINKLFRGEIVLSPETICLRLIRKVTGYGGGRNDAAYNDLCQRFSEYYKDGNYSLAISAIFVAYRFVLAPDIKQMQENNPVVERGVIRKNPNVLLNGVIVKDGSGQAVVVDWSDPNQILFRRP